jgi:hypothetical protein
MLKDWFRCSNKVFLLKYRPSSSTKKIRSTISLSLTTHIPMYWSLGVSKIMKYLTTSVTRKQEWPQLSRLDSDLKNAFRTPSTLSIQCQITTLCAQWGSRNGSSATLSTTRIDLLNMTWTPIAESRTLNYMSIIPVTDNGMRLHTHALTTFLNIW